MTLLQKRRQGTIVKLIEQVTSMQRLRESKKQDIEQATAILLIHFLLKYAIKACISISTANKKRTGKS